MSFSFKRFRSVANLFNGATPLDIPTHDRLKLWRGGFGSWAYYIYELGQNDSRDYLPDSAMKYLEKLNGPIGKSIFRNKLLFSYFFDGYLKIPKVLAFINKGDVSSVFAGNTEKFNGLDDLLDYCECYQHGLMLKPFDGAEGRGITHLTSINGRGYLNNKVKEVIELQDWFKSLDGYIVTPYIAQADYADVIFPLSTNTMRIITMYSSDQSGPFIAVAGHRFGTTGSAPTDNTSRGGLIAPINIDTGRLGQALKYPVKSGERLQRYKCHPDTHAQIEGAEIEGWSEIKAQLLHTVRTFPFLQYVGWDVAVTDEDIYVIEGNSGASLYIQGFNPYLRDPRIRHFLETHNII